MKVRRSLLKQTVTVATYTGDGAYGPVTSGPVSVRCNIDSTRRLVVNSSGEQLVAQATLQVHPNDADYFAPESTVTFDGQISRVISTQLQTFRGGTCFVEVICA